MNGYVLTVGDLHVGGMFSLFPESFRTSVGTTLALNSGQKYLLECWQDIIDQQPEVIDVLNLNGDIIEGQNKFEMSRGLSEVDPLWQVRAAEELLEPLVKRARNIRMTQGSTYHVGKGGGWEKVLAERIGAKEDKFGHPTSPWWKYWYKGVYFDLAHRQSTTIRYRSMPLEREVDFLLARFARRREAPPERFIITRSHTHAGFRVYQEDGAYAVSMPCMKLQDTFAQLTVSPNRIIPDNLGAVAYEVGDEAIKIIPYLYEHPEEGVDVIE